MKEEDPESELITFRTVTSLKLPLAKVHWCSWVQRQKVDLLDAYPTHPGADRLSAPKPKPCGALAEISRTQQGADREVGGGMMWRQWGVRVVFDLQYS